MKMGRKTPTYRGSGHKRRSKSPSTPAKKRTNGINKVLTPSPTKLPHSSMTNHFPSERKNPPEHNDPSVTPTTKNISKPSTITSRQLQQASKNKPPNDPTLKSNVNGAFLLEPSYKETLIADSMSDRSKSTFLLQKETYEGTDVTHDDDTVSRDNVATESEFENSVRMTMMFKLPSNKEGCSDAEAPHMAIQKMNEMLKVLSNKLPCRVGPWLHSKKKKSKPKTTDLL